MAEDNDTTKENSQSKSLSKDLPLENMEFQNKEFESANITKM